MKKEKFNPKMTRRQVLKAGMIAGAGLMLPWNSVILRNAYGKTPQPAVPLPGSAIPQFVDPLPDLQLVPGNAGPLTIRMQEFPANVMPSTFVAANVTYVGTYVWGYQTDGVRTWDEINPASTYINPVITAVRGTPTQITWFNELPTGSVSNTYWQDWTDQTLHWANPNNLPMDDPARFLHYAVHVPAVPHLHGGEVPPQIDGGPDAWFLPKRPVPNTWRQYGHAYYSKDWDETTAQDFAIYRYPNSQEAANIWFHDHALGITRINVYAGLAGAYLLSDPDLELPDGLGAHSIGPSVSRRTIIPLVIQDRMFDVDGQLYFPNAGDNLTLHPFWAPEFLGDTIVVNGKVWPKKDLDNNRYRFLFLNGSNARAYEMFLVDPVSKVMGPPMWVIGTDGGYLDAPVKIDPNVKPNDKLVMMPGERYDVIIDFNDQTWINNLKTFYGPTLPPTVSLLLRNTGRTPYPFGVTPQGSTLGRVMQFNITFSNTAGSDGYNPAGGAALRPPMIRLSGPTVTRQLTLNEVMGPAGPYEALVNNTKWDGHSVATDVFTDGIRSDFQAGPDGETYYSELPQEGVTELWEIINMTADAHPIHLHLVQFQLVNRQKFNVTKYTADYDALFPGSSAEDPATGLAHPPGVFIGGFGPPANYSDGKTLVKQNGAWTFTGTSVTTALGGNPDIGALRKNKPIYLQGPARPPLPQEDGWKDTVIMFPGEVTRIMVRWAPTDVTVGDEANEHFPFNPNSGHGFVWHCHIIDHEDNEMMRPDAVEPKSVPRTYTDY